MITIIIKKIVIGSFILCVQADFFEVNGPFQRLILQQPNSFSCAFNAVSTLEYVQLLQRISRPLLGMEVTSTVRSEMMVTLITVLRATLLAGVIVMSQLAFLGSGGSQ